MAIFAQTTRPFPLDEYLGVAIGIPAPDRPDQRHVGLIYRLDEREPRWCHLAFHHRLRDEPLDSTYHWGPSGLDPVNKTFMAAYVALLQQNARSVPYGIDYTGLYFDDEGRYLVQPLGKGLTCATFILAVFASRGFVLLDTTHWPERPDDAAWQAQIIEVLAAHAAPDHIEAIKRDIGARRFRPEEVAGAVLSRHIPLTFPEAAALAAEIVADLRAAS